MDAIPAILLFIVLLVLPGRPAPLGGAHPGNRGEASWGGRSGSRGSSSGDGDGGTAASRERLVSVSKVWGLALVGLSMVPLIGLGGQLSLSQLTFAGMGAIAYAHLGWHSPLGLVWAGSSPRLVGVLVALPAIRLEGIYIALSTAAFTVICDRWFFPLPEFSVGDHSFSVFQSGTLKVIRPDFLGIDLSGPPRTSTYSAVVFALLMLTVVALRRSYVRRPAHRGEGGSRRRSHRAAST